MFFEVSSATCLSYENQSTLSSRDYPCKNLLKRNTLFHSYTSSVSLSKLHNSQRSDQRHKRQDIHCLSCHCFCCSSYISRVLLWSFAWLLSCISLWADMLMLLNLQLGQINFKLLNRCSCFLFNHDNLTR